MGNADPIIRKLNITVGADPELFLVKKFTPISAVGLIGGTKRNPAPLGRDGFMIQEDNVAVEFNIPPAKSLQEFVESIEWSLDTIRSTVNQHGYSIRITASEIFADSELQTPEAKVFGCDPDFNAWTNRRNPRPKVPAGQENLRSAGGHIHLGWENPDQDPPEFKNRVIQSMDLYLGVPSIVMDPNVSRRKLYGKAGAHRKTSYGIEYRTLSNFWLRQSEYIKWAYSQSMRSMEFASDPANWKVLDELGPEIQKIINTEEVGNQYIWAKSLAKERDLVILV